MKFKPIAFVAEVFRYWTKRTGSSFGAIGDDIDWPQPPPRYQFVVSLMHSDGRTSVRMFKFEKPPPRFIKSPVFPPMTTQKMFDEGRTILSAANFISAITFELIWQHESQLVYKEKERESDVAVHQTETSS